MLTPKSWSNGEKEEERVIDKWGKGRGRAWVGHVDRSSWRRDRSSWMWIGAHGGGIGALGCGSISPVLGCWCAISMVLGWTEHSPSRGGDEDGDLTDTIVGSTARSLSLSLSVCAFVSPSFSPSFSLCASLEMVWNENNNGKYFTRRCPYFTVNTENIFSLTQFSVTTKHPLLRKSISKSGLKPKQTHP